MPTPAASPDPACSGLSNSERAALIGVAGVATTLAFNGLVILHARRQLRDNLITALRSDVRSIVQAFHLTHIVKAYVFAASLRQLDATTLAGYDTAREETYFKLYESLSPQLGTLPQDLAREVVRFYTFLHVSRDAAKPLMAMASKTPDLVRFHIHTGNVLIALREVLLAAVQVLGKQYSRQRSSDEGAALASRLLAEVNAAIKGLETHYGHPAPTLQVPAST